MSAPHPLGPQNPAFKFSSSEGYALCRGILSKLLSYEPHDVQIEGISKILDGNDLLRTGMGKTSFILMYILVVLEIQRDLSTSSC